MAKEESIILIGGLVGFATGRGSSFAAFMKVVRIGPSVRFRARKINAEKRIQVPKPRLSSD